MTALSDAAQDRLKRQLSTWRRELLDLSRRQSLLYFKHTRSASLEIVSPGAISALEAVDAGKAELVAEADAVGLRVADKTPQQLAASTKRIDQVTRQALVDRGVWTLYLGLGMLTWVDQDDGKSVDSPLVLVPVELRRPATSAPFTLHRSGDGASANLALARKFESDFGLVLPDVDELEPDVGAHLDAVRRAVAGRPGWSVSPRVILRNFTFHKEAIYRDLEENAEQVFGHPLVQLVSLGGEAPSAGSYDFTPVPDDELDEVAPPERLNTILSADSSQRRCILAARDGRSFVMDGPPGTGKSQTIANVVAELIATGKSVLFVSEKAAALDVVRSRLADRGLGDFLLELHSHTTGRKEVAVELERALSQAPRARGGLDGADEASVVAARRDLSAYAAAMNEIRPRLGRSLFTVLGRLTTLAPDAAVASADARDWSQLSAEDLAAFRREGADLAQVWTPITAGEDFLWRDLAVTTDDVGTVRELSNLASAHARASSGLADRVTAVDYDLPFGFARDFDGAGRRVTLLQALTDRPDVPAHFLTANDLTPVLDRLVDRQGAVVAHASAVMELRELAGDHWPQLPLDELEQLEAPQASPDGTWQIDEAAEVGALESQLRALTTFEELGRSLLHDATYVAAALGLPAESVTAARAAELAQLGGLAQTTTPPDPRWLNPALQRVLADSNTTLYHLVQLVKHREQGLSEIFKREALEVDLASLRTRLTTTHRGFRRFSRAAREDRALLRSITVAGRSDSQTVGALEGAVFWQQAEWQLRGAEHDHAGILGPYYRGTSTDFGRLGQALGVAHRAIQLAGEQLDPVALGRQVSTERQPDPRLPVIAARLEAGLERWRAGLASVLGDATADVVAMRPLATASAWCAGTVAALEPGVSATRRVADAARMPVTIEQARMFVRRAQFVTRLKSSIDTTADADRGVLGPAYRALDTDFDALSAALAWAEDVRSVVGGPISPTMVDRLSSPTLGPADLQTALDDYENAERRLLTHFNDGRSAELRADLRASVDEAEALLMAMADSADSEVPTWVQFSARSRRLRDQGLDGLLTKLVDSKAADDTVADAVEHAVLEAWVDSVIRADDRLSNYRAVDRDQLVTRFRDIDRKVVDLAYAKVVAACAARRPRSLVGDASIIIREAQKKTRHKPIREVLETAATVVQQVKPCFMMSPLSVSQYLPPSMKFDVVIFDEASQVSPSDAINCIYRGQQLIVAGDQKQLPPTSFFSRSSEDDVDEDDDLDVFDSVLDLCKGAGALPSLPLTWHYRSRHEDLITFSNHRFYEGRLHTFPGARFSAPDLGVAYYNVHGVYQRGGARDNPIEAAAVVERVIHHRREHPTLSLGVVALSGAQADAIEAALDLRVADDPSLEALLDRTNRLDGFFIKNLESVQGDERDVIIFSTGYGADENGKITMNFGPLTRKGGWRRLNVAITRARMRVEVVTSLQHSQIEPGANESHRHLRDYLHFAEVGRRALAIDLEGSLGDAESPFEEEVIRSIASWGYTPVPQVGTAGYRIDIGVRHPDKPAEYLMAVECDGAAYHSSKTARDRDRLREEVLVGLGWQVHRIWGLSWYRDRTAQEQRLRDALDSAMAAGDRPRPPREAERSSVQVDLVVVDLDARPSWAVPYPEADASTYCPYEPHSLEARPYLRRWLEQVLVVEAPLHRDVLLARMRDHWGIGRVGHRIAANVDAVLARVSVDGRPVRTDPQGFIRLEGAPAPVVRVPTSRAKRVVGQVPPEEIRAALQLLTVDAGSATEEQLSEAVSRLFGWARRGPDVRAAVAGALERLVQEGSVIREGGDRIRASH